MNQLLVIQTERNAYVEKLRCTSLEFATAVAKKLGCAPEDITFLREVSLDGGVKFRPVLNSDVLNLLFLDLEPGSLYRVGPLTLRRTIVVLGATDHLLTAPPQLLR